jgi:hypothetical protein
LVAVVTAAIIGLLPASPEGRCRRLLSYIQGRPVSPSFNSGIGSRFLLANVICGSYSRFVPEYTTSPLPILRGADQNKLAAELQRRNRLFWRPPMLDMVASHPAISATMAIVLAACMGLAAAAGIVGYLNRQT